VIVTASTTEVRPSSFTIAVRIRPLGGDHDVAANVSCVVHLEDRATGNAYELGKDIRDELIALEHSARHFN
jgi:acyl-CoA thioesterase FadM